MAFFRNKLNYIFFAAMASAALVGCGDDSPTNPGSGSSGEGAFRVARPAVYETKDGVNYFIYYWGKCTISNGVYNWNPQGTIDLNAYIISKDTIKVYHNSIDNEVDYFMYGHNSSIFGNWDVDYCRIKNGEYKCSPQLFNSTIEFKQDSMITYMTINPDYNLVNEVIHDIFHDYFNFCIYDKQDDETTNFVDMPERDITFNYQDNRNATITVQGQVVNIKVGGYTETKAIHYLFSVSSNGKTCSAETRFGYVSKAEYCSEAYKDYLTDDGGHEEDGDGIISTSYLRDMPNREEYSNCLKSLFENNPAYNPEVQ